MTDLESEIQQLYLQLILCKCSFIAHVDNHHHLLNKPEI